jgi:hypothetical protein
MRIEKREYAREFSHGPVKREQELHELELIETKYYRARSQNLVNSHQNLNMQVQSL